MFQPRRIDISALKLKFRAACATHGVDPLEGSTSYQVVHIIAEQRLAARRNASDAGWWRDHNLWRDDDTLDADVNALDSRTHAGLALSLYLDFAAAAGEASQRHDPPITPLRDLLAGRRERLIWVDLGDGTQRSIISSIDEPGRAGRPKAQRGFTDEQRAAARQLRAQGLSMLQISVELDINVATISRWMKQAAV